MNMHGFLSMEDSDTIILSEVAREWADKLTAFAHNMDELVDTGPDSE